MFHPSFSWRCVGWVLGIMASTTSVFAETQQRFDVQNFHPTPGPRDLIIAPQSQGLTPNSGGTKSPKLSIFNFAGGAFLNISLDPLVLINPFTNQKTDDLVRNRLQLDLMAAVGITKWFEMGLVFPVILFQQSGNLESIGQEGFIRSTVFGDIALIPKVPLVHRKYDAAGNEYGWGFALSMRTNFPTGSLENFASDGRVTVNPAATVDYRFGKTGILITTQTGVYVRPTVALANVERLGTMMTFAAGAEIPIPTLRKYGITALGGFYANVPLTTPIDQIGCVPAEFMLGGRWYADNGLTVSTGLNFGGGCGFGNPTFRYWVGTVYTIPQKLSKTFGTANADIIDWKKPKPCPTDWDPRINIPDRCPRVIRDGKQIKIIDRVNFATDKDTILEQSFGLLTDVANFIRDELKRDQKIKQILIVGHTDITGPVKEEKTPQDVASNDRYNQDLSNRRAQNVLAWLGDPSKGNIPQSLLKSKGMGRSQLLSKELRDKLPEAEYAKYTPTDLNSIDRRVEISVLYEEDLAKVTPVAEPPALDAKPTGPSVPAAKPAKVKPAKTKAIKK